MSGRSKRANRGNRMAALLEGARADDAAALGETGDDAEFWNQAYFQDAADDEHYSTESESDGAYKVDDDFFDDEQSDGASSGEAEAKARTAEQSARRAASARKQAYRDPKAGKRKRGGDSAAAVAADNKRRSDNKAVDVSALPPEWQARCATLGTLRMRQLRAFARANDIDTRDATAAQLVRRAQQAHVDWHKAGKPMPPLADATAAGGADDAAEAAAADDGVSVRRSTKHRTNAVRAHIERRTAEGARRRAKLRRQAEAQAANAPPPLTQEQRLEEAKRTEERNSAELERLLQFHDRERERRLRAAATRRDAIVGPRIRTQSSASGTTVYSFSSADVAPELFGAHAPPARAKPSEPARCAHSGQPAKYVDPRTGKPFASVAAFKQLRRADASRRAALAQQRADTLHQLLAESRERARRELQDHMPPSLAAPFRFPKLAPADAKANMSPTTSAK